MDFTGWTDAHFCNLSSQTTIHSLAKLRTEDDRTQFLVGTLNGSFTSIELKQHNDDKVRPTTKTVPFSNLPTPGDADIVAVSSLDRQHPKQGQLVAITYVIVAREVEKGSDLRRRRSPVKEEYCRSEISREFYSEKLDDLGEDGNQDQDSTPKSQGLNVYFPSKGAEGNVHTKLDDIAENCESLSLPYIPYCMESTTAYMKDGTSEPVFLVSGSDLQVHAYREVSDQEPGVAEIVPITACFPEFSDLTDIVEVLDFTQPDQDHRLTASGFMSGKLTVHHVNIRTLQILREWKTDVDCIVSSVHFFNPQKDVPAPLPQQNSDDENGHDDEPGEPSQSHPDLLMTCMVHSAVVYRNVLENGLSEGLTLPDSENFDSPICSVAADVDFDGDHEVVVGTYGQELLVYKFFPCQEKLVAKPQPTAETEGGSGNIAASPVCTSLSPEECSKLRHKSEENSPSEKGEGQQRRVKSQDDLLHLISEKELESGEDKVEEQEMASSEVCMVPWPHYKLVSIRPFPCPIMGLSRADLTGDGVENIIVMTSFAVHIMQPDMDKLLKMLTGRMKQLAEGMSEEDLKDEFNQLLLE